MYQQITSNKRKSLVLLVGFLLLYAGLGWLLSLWFGTGRVRASPSGSRSSC